MKFMRFTHSDLHKELCPGGLAGGGTFRPQGAPGRRGEKGHRQRGSRVGV